jgi:hypothetical protein
LTNLARHPTTHRYVEPDIYAHVRLRLHQEAIEAMDRALHDDRKPDDRGHGPRFHDDRKPDDRGDGEGRPEDDDGLVAA